MLTFLYFQVKGISYSILQDTRLSSNQSNDHYSIYDRVWDEADYVIPSSETNAFFVMTNLVVTPNQSRGLCAEDPFEVPGIICDSNQVENSPEYPKIRHNNCKKGRIFNYKSHGRESGNCIISDRTETDVNTTVCEIRGWCPVELDVFLVKEEPIIQGVENFTVLIKNTIAFPWFDRDKYRRDNMPNGICIYEVNKKSTWLCPIFRLGDIIHLAGGYSYIQIFRNKLPQPILDLTYYECSRKFLPINNETENRTFYYIYSIFATCTLLNNVIFI